MTKYSNTGGLWPNRFKGTHFKRPDYLGSITIDGKKYKLSAWENSYADQQRGLPKLSIRVNEDVVKTTTPPPTEAPADVQPPTDFDDDIPF